MDGDALRRLSQEPVLNSLFSYWKSKRIGTKPPDRRDIDPVDIPPSILPHLALIEMVERDRFKLRLVGTEVVRQYGRDNTGRFIDEYLSGDYLAYLTSLYNEVREKRLPILSESIFRHSEHHIHTTRLILPLTQGGAEIRIAFTGQAFHSQVNRPALRVKQPLGAGDVEIISQIVLDF